MQVNRGKFTFTREGETIASFTQQEDGTSCEGQVQKAEKEFLKDAKIRLYVSKNHVSDFMARVKDRAEAHHQRAGRRPLGHLLPPDEPGLLQPRADPSGIPRRAPSSAARAIPGG